MRHNPSDFDQIVESTHPREETLAELGRRIGDGFEAPAFLSQENAELTRLRAENAELRAKVASLQKTIADHIGIKLDGVQVEIWDK